MDGLSRFAGPAHALLRIMAGLLFLEHGMQKFLSFPPEEYSGAGWALNNPIAFAGVVELICGFLITIGLLTRPAAFIASGTMAVGYFMVHAPKNFFPLNNGGDAAVLYCFVFLFLAAAGAGTWSLEGRRRTVVSDVRDTAG